MCKFVHLSVHSDCSLSDSLIKAPQLVQEIAERNIDTVAITDASNLHASIKIYKNALSNKIKPIIGAELNVCDVNGNTGPLIVLCANLVGYKNLLRLSSMAYTPEGRGDNLAPTIRPEWITNENLSGLIVLTGGRNGLIGQYILENKKREAATTLQWLQSATDENSLFIELQRIGHPDDNLYNNMAVRLATAFNTPVVATNAVRFLAPEDFESHQIRAAIALKIKVEDLETTKANLYTPHQYLKTADEMAHLFRDIPSAITNTVEIAKRCTTEIELGKYYLPTYPYAAKENMSETDYMNNAARKGLEERLAFLYPNQDITEIRKEYDERLEFELNVINEMGFPGYFLIVMEFIQWSKDNDIPVGPGRGSGAGSLVAYALKITDLDPLEFDLLFERFLNPERVSMPDFDVDFCMDRRLEVIEHTAEMYGHDAVSQIATFGTMAAKGVVRDVARALGLPYKIGDNIAKLIPNEVGIKLSDAIATSADLQQLITSDGRIKEVISHAKKLEGLIRQTGRHAGGVVIAGSRITDFSGVTVDENGEHASTMLDKGDVEDVGLVKFDYLGLRTLTIVQNAVNSVNKKNALEGKEPFNILSIPLDDQKAFDLLKECETTAVFQLESQGMKTLIRRLVPNTFEEIIALVALFRPGPLDAGMVDDFVDRKHGRSEVEYIIPKSKNAKVSELLEPILKHTFGVIVYQEQVMQTAQALAGYTLGGADMLRRAMGKKKPSEMAKQRSVFTSGCENNGIPAELGNEIFDIIEKFAGYGFNKSHSAAYALVSYQTLWLKAHYPAEFMAAVLSASMDKTDRVVTFLNECERMGLEVLPPRVNMSDCHFTVNEKGQIVYGLGAVKGIGEAFIKRMVENRNQHGDFLDMHEWIARTNANKREIEAAIYCGALDGMGSHRASLIQSFKQAQDFGKKLRANTDIAVSEYSDLIKKQGISYVEAEQWEDSERLHGEQTKLGLYLTGHPLDSYETELASVITGKLVDHTGMQTVDDTENDETTNRPKTRDEAVVVAGQILDVQLKTGKQGNYASFKLDDKTRQLGCRITAKVYQNCFQYLKEGALVVIKGRMKWNSRFDEHQLTVYEMVSIEDMRNSNLSYIRVDIKDMTLQTIATEIKNALSEEATGGCRIYLRVHDGNRSKEVALPQLQIKVTNKTLEKLRKVVDESRIELIYRNINSSINEDGSSDIIKDHRNAEMKVIGERTKIRRHSEFHTAISEAKNIFGIAA